MRTAQLTRQTCSLRKGVSLLCQCLVLWAWCTHMRTRTHTHTHTHTLKNQTTQTNKPSCIWGKDQTCHNRWLNVWISDDLWQQSSFMVTLQFSFGCIVFVFCFNIWTWFIVYTLPITWFLLKILFIQFGANTLAQTTQTIAGPKMKKITSIKASLSVLHWQTGS